MESKLLIDSIVRQTTVLIAQLSTAAGLRAPLAHVADQVFLQLAREIEGQGVGRKVAADMFGLALRTYQRKVQRLTAGATEENKTLWQTVLEFLESGPASRSRLQERFQYDGEEHVGAVLNDLQSSGLIYCTGRGDAAVYGLTSAEDRAAVSAQQSQDALQNLVWVTVFQSPLVTRTQLAAQLHMKQELVDQAVAASLQEGLLQESNSGQLEASNVVIPLAASRGWEAAVFDHFSTVCHAIVGKLQKRGTPEAAFFGGMTVNFTVYDGHPYADEVKHLLPTMRKRINTLWKKVSDYNHSHPVNGRPAERVQFYFGQNVLDTDGSSRQPSSSQTSNDKDDA